VVGFVADRLGPVNTYILVFLLSGCVQFLFWLTAKNFAAICAFAVIYGIVCLSPSPLYYPSS
jgi:predicted MFS family arabinose efflux permease